MNSNALAVALRFHLCDIDETKTPEEMYQYISEIEELSEDELLTVWEPFENWGVSSLLESIWGLASDIESTFVEGK
jgi:hypothetical protein